MPTVRSRNGIPVRLTEERWLHIVGRHPEMVGQQEKVLETLSEPDMIQKGDFGEKLAVRRYAETPLGNKQLVVAYREVDAEDGFVVTAYLARRSSAEGRLYGGGYKNPREVGGSKLGLRRGGRRPLSLRRRAEKGRGRGHR